VVTYRYFEMTQGGVPRFPAFMRVREDVDASEFDVGASKEAPASPQKNTKTTPQKKATPQKKTKKAGPSSTWCVEPRFSARGVCDSESGGKFWEVAVNGDGEMVVKYGKLGSAGSCTTKAFADEAAATKEAKKLVRQKAGKGYEMQSL